MSKKSLNILIIDFDDLRNHLLSGGQARATFEVSHNLVQLGHKVTVLCSSYPGAKDYRNKGVFYKHFGLGSSNLKLNNIFFFLALPFAIHKVKADVIIECFTAPISTSFAPVFTKIPVIGMPTMFEAEEFTKKYHLPFGLIEKVGVKFYRYFLAYSQNNKTKMERHNPKVITRIIPNGVSEQFLKTKTSEGGYAVFIGRVDITQKGLDLLVNALAEIKERLRIRIKIAGNGPVSEEEKLLEMIKSQGLEEIIEFVGRVDGKEKEELLAKSLFGLYPSRFEDFPLVPLEYAALGKPLVCFDIPGLAWVPSEISLKAKAFETKELSKLILKITENNSLREKMRIKARAFAKKYGWKNISKEYASFAKEVVEIEKNGGTKK